MPTYRFIIPVRAIGGYRLPDSGINTGNISINPGSEPAYSARIEAVHGSTVTEAYENAIRELELLFGYLALLGEDFAFVLDGREGLRARNTDLEKNPIPQTQPPPSLESLFGVIFGAAQETFGAICDPDGSQRRSGAIAIFNANIKLTPSDQSLAEVISLFESHDKLSTRLKIALGIIHDASCAKDFAIGFAQSHTALEVLTEHMRPPTLLDSFFKETVDQTDRSIYPYKTKQEFKTALESFLNNAKFSEFDADRLVNYAMSAKSVSDVDVFHEYLNDQGIKVDRSEISKWRTIRGKLVHSAEQGAGNDEVMRRCSEIVRTAIKIELINHSKTLKGKTFD